MGCDFRMLFFWCVVLLKVLVVWLVGRPQGFAPTVGVRFRVS